MVDVDIEACLGLPEHIAAALPDDGDQCVVHVIPTFEAADSSSLAEALQSASCVEKLRGLWMSGRISAFHATTFPEGHRAARHQQWLDVGAVEGVGGGRGYSTEYEEGFEPYCVVHTAAAQAMSPVLYDERFLHPHLDKVRGPSVARGASCRIRMMTCDDDTVTRSRNREQFLPGTDVLKCDGMASALWLASQPPSKCDGMASALRHLEGSQ